MSISLLQNVVLMIYLDVGSLAATSPALSVGKHCAGGSPFIVGSIYEG